MKQYGAGQPRRAMILTPCPYDPIKWGAGTEQGRSAGAIRQRDGLRVANPNGCGGGGNWFEHSVPFAAQC